MPRYLLARCCDNPGHLTNRNVEHYIEEMIQAIRDVYSWINNTIFMRRIKGVKVFNPNHALGFNNYDVNTDTIIELWGEDPVHPTPAAHKVLADKLAAMVDDMLAGDSQHSSQHSCNQEKGSPKGALDPQFRAGGQAANSGPGPERGRQPQRQQQPWRQIRLPRAPAATPGEVTTTMALAKWASSTEVYNASGGH
jgi:hypothetical protein